MNINPAQPWHALESGRVMQLLGIDTRGLSVQEAETRLEEFGKNEITKHNGTGRFHILMRQFQSPLILILVFAGIIAFALGDQVNGAIIFSIVVLNAAIGFIQEAKVSKILAQLSRELKHLTIVLRGGRLHTMNAQDVTIGDIVVLRQGSKIPADGRIISSSNLKTNEAILTGESMPVEKKTNTLPAETPVSDQADMVFLGTLVEEGTARVVVTAIGMHTEFGKIAAMVTQERKHDRTPLQIQLASLARFLGVVFVSLSALLFGLGFVLGRDPLTMFLTSVAVAVAAVPESLPVGLGIVLAVGSRRILARGGLVRKMSAAEALGNVTVIATDKTATLTEGKLHVTELVSSDGARYTSEYFPELIRVNQNSTGYRILRGLTLSSNAFVENPDTPQESWHVSGTPIDRAILLSASQAGLYREQLETESPRLDELTFDARFRYSAVLNRLESNNTLTILGAPEVLLEKSIMSTEAKSELLSEIERLARQGFRVLGLAERVVHTVAIDRAQISDLAFLGLVAFSDPIRPDVTESITRTHNAGIRPIMVTGDHARTAEYIAKQTGILTDPKRIIEGKNLPIDLEDVVQHYDVFARVDPESKVNIVKALQAKGERVAMIGDGVNDAAALLRSDIGVAVGSGTDVAREASDLVLLNDSFGIIVEAVRQGRIVLGNIRKIAIFLLSDAFTEVIMIGGSIILGLPLALLPAQILWMNLVEDVLPAIALAFERELDPVMHDHPSKHAQIFSREAKILIGMFTIITDGVLFGLFVWLLSHGASVPHARTLAFLGTGVTSLLYVFSLRSLRRPVWRTNPFSNVLLDVSVLFGIGMYAIALYVPQVRTLLGTVPLHGADWLFLGAICLLNIMVLEAGKRLFLSRQPV